MHLFHTCAIIYLLHYKSPVMLMLSSLLVSHFSNQNSGLCPSYLALVMFNQTKTVIHNKGCGIRQFEEFLLDAHSKTLLLSLKLLFLHILISFRFFLLFYFACPITFGLWSSEQRLCFLTCYPYICCRSLSFISPCRCFYCIWHSKVTIPSLCFLHLITLAYSLIEKQQNVQSEKNTPKHKIVS